jgi:fatty-acyl-CoA synthase
MAASRSVWEMVARGARDTPERSLIVEADGSTYSFADVYETSLRWARALGEHGSSTSRRIALLLPHQAALHIARLAAGRIGAVAGVINPLLVHTVLADALSRTGATDLIVSDATSEAVRQLRHQLAPGLRIHHLSKDGLTVQPSGGSDRVHVGIGRAALATPDPEHTKLIVYTSGTSGQPRPCF